MLPLCSFSGLPVANPLSVPVRWSGLTRYHHSICITTRRDWRSHQNAPLLSPVTYQSERGDYADDVEYHSSICWSFVSLKGMFDVFNN